MPEANNVSYQYDVFISYSHVDAEWVQTWLVPRLRKYGLSICIDSESFDIGVPALVNMENAVTVSRHSLLVLTPDWLGSQWTHFESLLVQQSDPIGLVQRTIPVMHKPTSVPNRIAMLTYANLTDPKSEQLEFDRIIDALKGIKRIHDLTNSQHRVVNMPFVILAMNHEQATSLLDESSPSLNSLSGSDFLRFKQLTTLYGEKELLSLYANKRDEWRLYAYTEKSIEEIISEVIEDLNQSRLENPETPQIRAQFYSETFFSKDAGERLQLWEQLSESGCVIVADAVSLFHPEVSHFLLHSELSSNPRVAILILSPISPNLRSATQIIEQQLVSLLERAFLRFAARLDKLCEFTIGDLRTLERWLYVVLPEAVGIVQDQRPNPRIRKVFRERVKRESAGIGRLITGQETL